MIIDLNKDWMNAPVKHGLTPDERQRMMAVTTERARMRRLEAENAEATLVALAMLLARRGR
ncbi:hypothetical protein [Brevundimonas vesicularis]|uniref:hypothetical protein n=1 Tax=Brevundimonas vesicularis TaxID=41276 RepID=UPI0022AC7C9F|nr:hypothetical protein [Brevundimonas vesicularis]